MQGTSPFGARWGGWLHGVARTDSMRKDQFCTSREVGLDEAAREKAHRPTHARISAVTLVKCACLGTGPRQFPGVETVPLCEMSIFGGWGEGCWACPVHFFATFYESIFASK